MFVPHCVNNIRPLLFGKFILEPKFKFFFFHFYCCFIFDKVFLRLPLTLFCVINFFSSSHSPMTFFGLCCFLQCPMHFVHLAICCVSLLVNNCELLCAGVCVCLVFGEHCLDKSLFLVRNLRHFSAFGELNIGQNISVSGSYWWTAFFLHIFFSVNVKINFGMCYI